VYLGHFKNILSSHFLFPIIDTRSMYCCLKTDHKTCIYDYLLSVFIIIYTLMMSQWPLMMLLKCYNDIKGTCEWTYKSAIKMGQKWLKMGVDERNLAQSKTIVYEWHEQFIEGHKSVKDDTRICRPNNSWTVCTPHTLFFCS